MLIDIIIPIMILGKYNDLWIFKVIKKPLEMNYKNTKYENTLIGSIKNN